jgi:hypothetical protein
MRSALRFRFPRRALPALAAALAFTVACDNKKSPEQSPPPVADFDRAGPSPTGTAQTVLQKTFSIHASEVFPLDIPAHAAMPRLSGNYKSYVSQLGIQSGDHAADVDFFVLTAEQYADYVRDGTIDSLFSANASHDQRVDVSLPPSLTQPKKFYLIFRSSPGSDPKKVVKADLSINF